jgi:hypothetical protein
MYWEDAHAFEKVSEQGTKVANAVLSAIRDESEGIQALPLGIERDVAWMPTETPVTTSRPPKNYGKPLVALANLPSFMAVFADMLLKRRYPWKPVIEERNGYWSVPMRINLLRIGDLAVVTFGAETFTEIGMKVKDTSPAAHTLFASITDGCISYLHTEGSHSEGGYEVDVAPLAYRYPGKFQAKCESIALRHAEESLKNLWS